MERNTLNSINPESTDNQSHATENDELTGETQKNSRLALYIAFLALFFTTVGITVGYKHWLRINDKAKAALEEIVTIKEQLQHTADKSKVEALKTQLEHSSKAAQQRLTDSLIELDQIREQTIYSAQTVTDQIKELTQQQFTLNNTHYPFKATDQKIQLTEVRYLLESAKRRFTLNYDKDSAIKLLKAADQILIQVASPELLGVRKKLAEDIAALEQFSPPNIKELSSAITTLEGNIKPLADLEKKLPHGEQVALFDIKDKARLWGKIKNYINESVSIRKQTTLPRYAPNQSDKQRIDQLLQLRMESLRLMVIQRHNQLFHLQIAKIKHMLELYYSTDDTKPWLMTLNQWDAIDLSPSRPDITAALNSLLQMPSLTKTAPNSAKKDKK